MIEEIQKFVDNFEVDLDLTNVRRFDKSYYLVSQEQLKIIDGISIEPASSGLYVGDFDPKTDKFTPSLMLMELLASKNKNNIVVRKKSEFLFTCGRDLFKDSVAKFDFQVEINQLVLIVDHLGQFLGLGKIKNNYDSISKNDLFIESLFDVGDFLRREVKKFNKSKRRRK